MNASSIYELIELTSAFGQAGILVAVLVGLWSGYGGPRAALWAILACVAANLWTLAIDPYLHLIGGAEAVSMGQALAIVLSGDAEVVEGYFLLSLVVSALAYVAGAETERIPEDVSL